MLPGLAGLALTLTALAAPAAASAQRPPPFLLESRAGTQRGVQESYCVSMPSGTGAVAGCALMVDARPRRLSVVRPRERVTVVLRGATIVHEDPSCHPRCDAGAAAYRLRAEKGRVIRTFPLTSARTRWRVRLRPGRYELEVGVSRFTMPDGRTGDTSATFGLLVSRTRPLAIVRAPRLPDGP
jgi:hypothetical protein